MIPTTDAALSRCVSSEGGHDAVWARDGREIFYTNGPKLMAAGVMADPAGVRTEPPRVRFDGRFSHDDTDPNIRFIDAAPDGRLLIVEPIETAKAASIVVIQHWGEELKRLLPV